MAETQIEWTDATWNPVAGCKVMSAGCTNCYAMNMARRLEAMGVEKYKGLTRKSGKRIKVLTMLRPAALQSEPQLMAMWFPQAAKAATEKRWF